MPAWQVLGEGAAESRFEALRAATTPLVGRDEEMDLLLRRWEQAKRGKGRVVLISAEPGVGKSRLAEDLAERIGAEPHTRLRYFCSPHHQDSALYPVIAQMERAAGFRREDTPEQRLDKLQALLASSDQRSRARTWRCSLTCCRSRPPTAPPLEPHAAEAQREDASGAVGAGRRSGAATAGADDVR